MKCSLFLAIALSVLLLSCNNESQPQLSQELQETLPVFQNKGHELVYKMVQKVGDYKALVEQKDVVYTYTYQTPDGKTDVSTEKYRFDGELSYGAYQQHERTFPDLDGPIEQGYDGSEFWLKQNGKILTDSNRLKMVAFKRPTNFYWFAMFQKLLDEGLNYEQVGEETINDMVYDVVKVTFNSNEESPKDVYQLYINKKTALVDQFLFTVADFGIIETPFLMTVEHEDINGILVPTKRQYKKSTWNAEVSEGPWIKVTWSNVKFNNGLSKATFEK